ncbi:MAG: hypothetical protein KDD66_05055 [Bdellovibrionales bacterium]|nr:hypothetical protein [Bdellovibrionales bacterium]
MKQVSTINLIFASIGFAHSAIAAMLLIDNFYSADVQHDYAWPLVILFLTLCVLLILDRARQRSFLRSAVIISICGIGLCYYGAVITREVRALLLGPLASCLVFIGALSLRKISSWLGEEDPARRPEFSGTTLGAAMVGLAVVFLMPVGLAPTLLFYPPAVQLERGRVEYDVKHSGGQEGIRVSADVSIRGYATVYDWTLAAFLVASSWKDRPDEPWPLGLPSMARLYRLQSDQLTSAQDKDFLTKSGKFFLPYSVVENTTGQLAPSFTDLYQPSSVTQVKRAHSPLRFAVEIYLLTFAKADSEPNVRSLGHIPLDGRTTENYGAFARSDWAKLIALDSSSRPAGQAPERFAGKFDKEAIEEKADSLWTVVRANRNGKVVAAPVNAEVPEVGSKLEIFFRIPAQNIDAVRAVGSVTAADSHSFTIIVDDKTQTGTIHAGDLIRDLSR